MKRRLQWFGHVARRPDTILMKQVLNPEPCQGWKRRSGGQIKTWLDTVKTDVERLGLAKVYGLRRWKSEWVDICSTFASDRRAWAAAIRDIREAD